MYYVYILYSIHLKKKYIGSTSDLKKRVSEHKSGRSRYTSRSQDWSLVYYEVFSNKNDAVLEERFLKTGKGRERLKFLLQNTIR
ncbi:MAG: GIY-YIG nuclease family protein [Candidatus Nomurabacteria bacterium]|nr:MAG: GIY-YIG nuclease family protein [Candidatus Nomurabacteria bacterium]